MADKKDFRVLHGFDKVPARVAGYETPERNHELVFRKKENVLILGGIRVAEIDAEDAFGNQTKVIAHHLLHIEKIPFAHFPRFPKRPAVCNIFIVQLREMLQMFS